MRSQPLRAKTKTHVVRRRESRFITSLLLYSFNGGGTRAMKKGAGLHTGEQINYHFHVYTRQPVPDRSRRPLLRPLSALFIAGFALLSLGRAGAAGLPVAPGFSLTMDELSVMTKSLPPEIRDPILARPSDFLRLVARVLDEPAAYFLLVDKGHLLAPDYAPPELARLPGTTGCRWARRRSPSGKQSCRICSRWRRPRRRTG